MADNIIVFRFFWPQHFIERIRLQLDADQYLLGKPDGMSRLSIGIKNDQLSIREHDVFDVYARKPKQILIGNWYVAHFVQAPAGRQPRKRSNQIIYIRNPGRVPRRHHEDNLTPLLKIALTKTCRRAGNHYDFQSTAQEHHHERLVYRNHQIRMFISSCSCFDHYSLHRILRHCAGKKNSLYFNYMQMDREVKLRGWGYKITRYFTRYTR